MDPMQIYLKIRQPAVTLMASASLLVSIHSSCGNKDNATNDALEEAAQTAGFQDGDSFPETLLPEEFRFWIDYYKKLDTSVTLSNFKASGVALHFGPLEEATQGDFTLQENFYPLMAFSPDSSLVIDWISYNHFVETTPDGGKKLIGGEADQEVALLVPGKSIARQLMFNGPQTSVETAAWLTNDAFLLGLIQSDESQNAFTPEIMLFNLKDSTFTNFRLNKSIPNERQAMADGDFTSSWLTLKKFKP